VAIWDLFSKREKRRARQGKDVFQYENLPQAFRVQVVHILVDALGQWDHSGFQPNQWWHEIHRVVAREKGLFQLDEAGFDPFHKCTSFLLNASTKDALDLIEVAFTFVDTALRRPHEHRRALFGLGDPDSAINELNRRFREHCIGYEFAGGEIIRIDSKYLHAETVKPALQVLQGAGKYFSGPLEEFLKAHEHYRKGNQMAAILNAGKSFESTLKSICTARGWPFDSNKDGASKLLETVFSKCLIPSYLQTHFAALRSVLESGVPTVRNKASGHGRGATPTTVPDHLVAYVLHATAANIVLLMEAHQA
jgi:hypothetical protein